MDSRLTNRLQPVINGWALLIASKRATQEFKALERVWASYTAILQSMLQCVKVVEKSSHAAQLRWTRPSKLTPRVSHLMAILKFALLVLPAGWLTQDQLNQLNQQTAQQDLDARVRKYIVPEVVHPLFPSIRKFFECFTAIDSDSIDRGMLLTR
jgi:hypothetical protein